MDQVLSALSNPAVISVVAMVIEALLHAVPSQKPMGIMHVVSGIIHKVGSVADAVAAFLDKVIPQNLS